MHRSPHPIQLVRRRGIALLGVVGLFGLLATSMAACRSEEEKVVEKWEAFAELLVEHGDDCGELAEAIDAFREENAAWFSAEKRSLYEAVDADPELHLRMERAFARLEVQDFACQTDERVQAASRKLFGELAPAPPGE